MSPISILYPVFALAAWTFLVLGRVALTRLSRAHRPHDFRYGESDSVTEAARLANRNYMNLLELPVLFYAACGLLFAGRIILPFAVGLAWLYVALRIAHSLVHLGSNNVVHRLALFTVSNIALLGLWIVAAIALVAEADRL